MDALIRSVQLASHRTRLGEARGVAAISEEAAAQALREEALASMRAEIEQQVRAELTAQMQALCDSECEQARRAGLAVAQNDATAAAAKELAQSREQLKAEFQRTLSALQQAHRAALLQLESNLAEVAFAAVCRLVTQQAASQCFVLGMVERVCGQLRGEIVATARLHPRDVQLIAELLRDHELQIASLALKVVADESLELGGCVIEAASGRYDGSLENQLRRLHAVLVGPTGVDRGHEAGNASSKVVPNVAVQGEGT